MELKQQVYKHREIGLLSDAEMKKALLIQKEMFPEGVPKCGTDALRYTLASVRIKDQAINFSVYYCSQNLAFCNKIWQASKFIIGWANSLNINKFENLNPTSVWHWWILSRLSHTVESINTGFSTFDFQLASTEFRNFFILDLCDLAVELSKPILLERNSESVSTSLVLLYCLETSLRLISPTMPFLSEELYSYLPTFMTDGKPVCTTSFPDTVKYSQWKNDVIENEMNIVRKVISSIRNLKARVKAFSKDAADVVIVSDEEKMLEKYLDIIKTSSRCDSIKFSHSAEKYTLLGTVEHHTKVHLFIPLTEEQMVGYIEQVNTKITRLYKQMNNLQARKITLNITNDEGFDEIKLKSLVEEIGELEAHLSEIQSRRM